MDTTPSPTNPSSSHDAGIKIPGDRYEIEGRLGAGSFGSVYKAIDTFLGRAVAIKSISLATSGDLEQRKSLSKRFIREAQVAAQLHHPNIVTIYDIMFTPEMGFIVMEYIEGSTLQQLLRNEPISVATAVDIAIQVGKALEYAHEHKVIHRDIKPGNIIITQSWEARITDFGIATSEGATSATMSGGLVGTPDYMSPEQAKGEGVDSRSDIFSLGCVLYECLAGQKPFKGGSLTGVLLSIVNTDPLQSDTWKRKRYPPELEAVLRRALAKDPARRTPSGRELVEALRALPAGLLLPVGTTTPKDKVEPRAPIMPPEAQYRMGAETLKRLKEDGRPLRFSSSLSSRLREMSLSPTEGFILSRVDGTSKASEILALSPMPENEVAETIAELVHKGLITWDDPDSSASSGSKLDPALEKELGRLLDLGKRRRYSELLGVDVSTPPPQVKQSYLELIQRFHPEAHPKDLSPETRHRLSELCAVATRALTTLSRSRTKPPVPPKRVRSDFDRTRHAWEIFRRAERAYETTDYWDAIQLARQAIELDQEQASFYYLLGLGLMKNRNWLKEAEGHLRRAAELDPSKADYFGQLASVYKELGMVERSATMLEKAKAIDPNFSLS